MAPPSKNAHVLARLRQTIGLSQDRLAQLVGCSKSAVQRIELGKLPLSPELAWRIAQATGVSLEWLLAGDFTDDPISGGGMTYDRQTYERWRAWQELKPASDKDVADILGKEGGVIGLSGEPVSSGQPLPSVIEQFLRGPKKLEVVQGISPKMTQRIAKREDQKLLAELARQRWHGLMDRFTLTMQSAFRHPDRELIFWWVGQVLENLIERFELKLPKSFSEREIKNLSNWLDNHRDMLKQKSEQSSKSGKNPADK